MMFGAWRAGSETQPARDTRATSCLQYLQTVPEEHVDSVGFPADGQRGQFDSTSSAGRQARLDLRGFRGQVGHSRGHGCHSRHVRHARLCSRLTSLSSVILATFKALNVSPSLVCTPPP